ncbi:hypothetical protein [Crenothrix polyspora]|uniref:Roadblock/LAMTOR2 domain-containing protein n=1 Tax=Crenothrix polyspora TaxID=360316 RepID=A0A1R4HEB0_9GAMM|nr:hypothetical protein [Crenothrix polyspora]SJM94554.1 conserved hypothetical protein [Crenothrix polyspora]
MASYKLENSLYLYPTPAGAYYAIASNEADKSRQFLCSLLQQQQTPSLNIDNLKILMNLDNEESCLDLLYHCQRLGWVQGVHEILHFPQQPMEKLLPGLLTKLSHTGKALLADNEGFYLASSGFPHEVSEELSALSAEIAVVYNRRSGVLIKNLGLASNAWAVIDASGNSKIGFWPIMIGAQRFHIVISGPPSFNQAEFVSLIWVLTVRYAKTGITKESTNAKA